jgi:hypothetical protein
MEAENRHPKIFLISGKPRHGKDTVGNMLKEEYEKLGKKCAILKFGKYIKEYAKELGWDGREETKPRDLLQYLNATLIRKKLKMPTFQARRMKEDIKVLSYFFDVLIIPDLRFPEEIERQKKSFENVVAIRVNRPNFTKDGLTEAQAKAINEIALDDYKDWDYIVTNRTLDGLHKDVLKIVNENK